MECSNVFIEIDGKEIQRPFAKSVPVERRSQRLIKVDGGLGGQWPDLLITAGISRDEEDWYTLDLL